MRYEASKKCLNLFISKHINKEKIYIPSFKNLISLSIFGLACDSKTIQTVFFTCIYLISWEMQIYHLGKLSLNHFSGNINVKQILVWHVIVI